MVEHEGKVAFVEGQPPVLRADGNIAEKALCAPEPSACDRWLTPEREGVDGQPDGDAGC